MPRFVVTRAIPQPALDRLAAAGDLWVSPHDRPLTTDELHAAVAGADAVLALLHDRVDAALLEAAGPQLRAVANVAVGYDNVDIAACATAGVTVTNTPGVLTDATADLALALILMVTRRLGEAERLVRRREAWAFAMDFHLGASVQGRTLGIVGMGQIGRATAQRARALGMEIAYAQRHRADDVDATYLALDDLLCAADVVSLHCPLTPDTHHLLDARRLALLRPSTFVVNTARGPLIDEAALARALAEGRIAGAGLDVHEHEPAIHADLLERDDVVLLPHLGSATVQTRTAMAELAARNAIAVAAGDPPVTPVTP